MKKEIIICIIVILLIFILDFITENNTNNVMGNLEEMLENTKENIIIENDEDMEENIEEAINFWEEKRDILSLYIEHDELEKLEMYLREIKTDIGTKEYNMAMESLETCLYVIEHIKDKYKLSIKNIF